MKPKKVELINADPLSWMHSSCVPEGAIKLKGIRRGIVNKIINEMYSLTQVNDEILKCKIARAICESWFNMNRVIHYMACYRNRGLIMQSITQKELSKGETIFMNFNKSPSAVYHVDYRDRVDIRMLSINEAYSFSQKLPEAIATRLVLLFGKYHERPAKTLEFNMVLFMMALRHARNYNE